MNMLESLGTRAKLASRTLSNASTELKNSALLKIAQRIQENADRIISANQTDLENGKEAGLSEALLDRLALNETRIKDMVQGVADIVALPDPVGRIERGTQLPNGLQLLGIRVPFGVVGIIYESRPNVTCDAAALCIKSGNAVILRGGKEAINSNMAIVEIMRAALEDAGLPADCIQLVEDTSRESATALMQLSGYLDVLIPRGGPGLIRSVIENSRVPVIETGAGNCHIFVDATADINMAAEIVYNAKCSRPSVCNALETLLVHKDIASKVLPVIKQRLDQKNTQIRGCEKTREILGDSVVPVTDKDYKTEFLDYILAVRVVESIDQAIEHICEFSTGHSEAIITESYQNARRFEREIDAAAVYVNASTRFTDGGQFGFGAEIGISTQKLHARGPMGLSELTSLKYVVRGNGQVR